MNVPHRVVLADDHPVTRAGIRAMLEMIDDVMVVGDAATGEEAVEVVRERDASIVLMDINMTGMSGIEATRAIKQQRPATSVIILSVHDDEPAIIEALRAGASAYLTKSSSLREIREALDSVRVDGVYLAPAVTGQVLRSAVRMVSGANGGARAEPGGDLTERERQVLLLLGEGLTARAIAHRLEISERTVNTHVGNLYRRMGVNNRVDAVRAGMRAGLIETPT